MYKQPIKLSLVKMNQLCEDFIPILEQPSLFFYMQVFLYWPYSDISDAIFSSWGRGEGGALIIRKDEKDEDACRTAVKLDWS